MSAEDGLPAPPHLASEFYVWLWWATEVRDGSFDLGGELGHVDIRVDERLAFRNPNDTKVSAVMTGDNPGAQLESRAALAGGKVLQDLRIIVRRDDREFGVTLKGPSMDLQRMKLPQQVDGGGEESLYDRMFLYEELTFVLSALYKEFSATRVSPRWKREVLPAIQAWVQALPEPMDEVLVEA
jgi:hypothetical protein